MCGSLTFVVGKVVGFTRAQCVNASWGLSRSRETPTVLGDEQ